MNPCVSFRLPRLPTLVERFTMFHVEWAGGEEATFSLQDSCAAVSPITSKPATLKHLIHIRFLHAGQGHFSSSYLLAQARWRLDEGAG
jgi:hypothetical protein